MKKLYLSTLLIGLLFNIKINAQDLHFSQFQLAPLLLNPALAGVGSCGRIIVNARSQWASVLKSNRYQTYALSYDQPIFLKNGDKLGVGWNAFYDKAGQLDFQTLSNNLNIVYHKKISAKNSQKHYLSTGLQLGMNRRSINFTKAQWASQHDGQGGFDPNAPSGEDFPNDVFWFGDISLGIGWQSIFENGNSFNGGFRFSHINRANQSFDPNKDLPLYTAFAVHGQANLSITPKFALIPRFQVITQGPSFELVGGSGVQFFLKENRDHALEIGAATRLANKAAPFDPNMPQTEVTLWTDAAIFNLSYFHPKFIIGLSYDHNVSTLNKASNGNGAYEMALVYRFHK